MYKIFLFIEETIFYLEHLIHLVNNNNIVSIVYYCNIIITLSRQ